MLKRISQLTFIGDINGILDPTEVATTTYKEIQIKVKGACIQWQNLNKMLRGEVNKKFN